MSANVHFSVLVDRKKGEVIQDGGWGRLGGETPQEGVEPPSLVYLCAKCIAIGVDHSENGQQSPEKSSGSWTVPRTSSTD